MNTLIGLVSFWKQNLALFIKCAIRNEIEGESQGWKMVICTGFWYTAFGSPPQGGRLVMVVQGFLISWIYSLAFFGFVYRSKKYILDKRYVICQRSASSTYSKLGVLFSVAVRQAVWLLCGIHHFAFCTDFRWLLLNVKQSISLIAGAVSSTGGISSNL